MAPFYTTAQLGRALSRCEGWIAGFGKLKEYTEPQVPSSEGFLGYSEAICISNKQF